ncbi:hypothetical protein ADUPG1_009700 [Aduncisulcus paluster]|uniref:Uncharacterized protein n=1 Tax=Aduncisulcus paluster TaxID=2918883 RepID=A0ABQ5KWJ4_9EUKA|nr:hypothetical protein ADUPG1_009700 [Aduncisulcus paluster]
MVKSRFLPTISSKPFHSSSLVCSYSHKGSLPSSSTLFSPYSVILVDYENGGVVHHSFAPVVASSFFGAPLLSSIYHDIGIYHPLCDLEEGINTILANGGVVHHSFAPVVASSFFGAPLLSSIYHDIGIYHPLCDLEEGINTILAVWSMQRRFSFDMAYSLAPFDENYRIFPWIMNDMARDKQCVKDWRKKDPDVTDLFRQKIHHRTGIMRKVSTLSWYEFILRSIYYTQEVGNAKRDTCLSLGNHLAQSLRSFIVDMSTNAKGCGWSKDTSFHPLPNVYGDKVYHVGSLPSGDILSKYFRVGMYSRNSIKSCGTSEGFSIISHEGTKPSPTGTTTSPYARHFLKTIYKKMVEKKEIGIVSIHDDAERICRGSSDRSDVVSDDIGCHFDLDERTKSDILTVESGEALDYIDPLSPLSSSIHDHSDCDTIPQSHSGQHSNISLSQCSLFGSKEYIYDKARNLTTPSSDGIKEYGSEGRMGESSSHSIPISGMISEIYSEEIDSSLYQKRHQVDWWDSSESSHNQMQTDSDSSHRISEKGYQTKNRNRSSKSSTRKSFSSKKEHGTGGGKRANRFKHSDHEYIASLVYFHSESSGNESVSTELRNKKPNYIPLQSIGDTSLIHKPEYVFSVKLQRWIKTQEFIVRNGVDFWESTNGAIISLRIKINHSDTTKKKVDKINFITDKLMEAIAKAEKECKHLFHHCLKKSKRHSLPPLLWMFENVRIYLEIEGPLLTSVEMSTFFSHIQSNPFEFPLVSCLAEHDRCKVLVGWSEPKDYLAISILLCLWLIVEILFTLFQLCDSIV